MTSVLGGVFEGHPGRRPGCTTKGRSMRTPMHTAGTNDRRGIPMSPPILADFSTGNRKVQRVLRLAQAIGAANRSGTRRNSARFGRHR